MIKKYYEFNEYTSLIEYKIKHIELICEKYKIKSFTINEDLTVDVNTMVDLSSYQLTEFPLKFGVITGSFYCVDNNLTSLKGAPKEVHGTFDCTLNDLKSLEFGPKFVSGNYICSENDLITLKGSPDKVTNFNCQSNKLENLIGAPKEVYFDFNCSNNNITSLKGMPNVGRDFNCNDNSLKSLISYNYCAKISLDNNPIYDIWRLIGSDIKKIDMFLDMNIHSDDPEDINLEKVEMVNNNK